MFNGFYKDKKVFLTGHTGFEGCWLTLWLKSLGANVLGYALEPDTVPSMYEEVKLYSHCKNEFGNISDTKKLNSTIKQFEPEIVINLASQPIVGIAEKNPIITFQTNVMGTMNVLEAAKLPKTVKAFLDITSGACYLNREIPCSEDEIIGGSNIYSSSMACKEMMIQAYRNCKVSGEYFLATARGGNAVGGGDWISDRLIPDYIKSMQESNYIRLRKPYAIRPFQHILDLLSGYLLLAKKLYENGEKYSTSFNFGANDDGNLQVRDFLQRFINVYGQGKISEYYEEKYPESDKLILSNEKAKDILKWTPTFSIEETIDLTVEWYKKFYANQDDMFDVTMKQIKLFEEKCTWNKEE
jgi:CDP-glucose 4,6-dehydratase